MRGHSRVVDYLTYTNLGPDRSYGDLPNGQPFARRRFFRVSPGAPNDEPEAVLFINEWMAANVASTRFADPADGQFDDWFEIYNPSPTAVDLG